MAKVLNVSVVYNTLSLIFCFLFKKNIECMLHAGFLITTQGKASYEVCLLHPV